ncbi:MAG: hypothetical protein F4Y56_04690 [Acidimicrobiaceae bacterium]|nr:hypothetical protein [Acidimicrobiaceae bacterium]
MNRSAVAPSGPMTRVASVETVRSAADAATAAASGRVPATTGWTNSTATWWAWSGAPGAHTHNRRPAVKARASHIAASTGSRPQSMGADPVFMAGRW